MRKTSRPTEPGAGRHPCGPASLVDHYASRTGRDGSTAAAPTIVLSGLPASPAVPDGKTILGQVLHQHRLEVPAPACGGSQTYVNVHHCRRPTTPACSYPTLDARHVIAFVDGLNLLDPEECLADLAGERARFLSARHLEPNGLTLAEYRDIINAAFATRRRDLSTQISKVEALPERRQDVRVRWEFDTITVILVRLNHDLLIHKFGTLLNSASSPQDLEDVNGAATVGLLDAIDTFDPALGPLDGWAFKRMLREILSAVRHAAFPTMSASDFEMLPRVLQAHGELSDRTGKAPQPSLDNVASAAGVSSACVDRVLNAPRLQSLQVEVDADGTAVADVIASDDDPVDTLVLRSMDDAALTEYGLSTLDTREEFVIVRRYGLDGEPPQSLRSIGAMLRRSREAVRDIESTALAKLVHPTTLRSIERHGRL